MARLCRVCEVSERTLYRDIAYLQSRNILIQLDQERGGYYLANKTYVQSLFFTPEEALAIQMALTARPLGSTMFGRAARSALEKIELATHADIETSPAQINASFVLEPASITDYSELEDIFNLL